MTAKHRSALNLDNPDEKQATKGEFTSFRFQYLIPIVTIFFILGYLSARLVSVETDTRDGEAILVVKTITPVPPTPTVMPTPTPNPYLQSDMLPTLYIDIAPDEYDLITAKRQQALEDWILISTDEDYVAATIRLGTGPEINAKLRLKGDWADHFFSSKWSYRIQLLNSQTILGMRVFSIQAPQTRSYLNEWLFLDNLRQEDVLAVRYSFVNVVENGADKGVYALEEAFSKELYESLDRREGVMIRYNEDLLWRSWAELDNDLSIPRGVTEFYIIDEFQTNKILNDPDLLQQRITAVEQLRGWWQGTLTSSEVYDAETMAKFLALSDLWGAGHALQWHNLRYYYNPITAKLEPVAFDAQPLEQGSWVELSELKGVRQTLRLDDPELQKLFVQVLQDYTDPHYLEVLHQSYGTLLQRYRNALLPEYGTTVDENGHDVLDEPWETLEIRQRSLRELLHPLQMTYVYMQKQTSTSGNQLSVGNLLDFPVQIAGINIGDVHIPTSVEWLAPESADLFLDPAQTGNTLVLKPLALDATFMHYARILLPESYFGNEEITPEKIELETRIWGLSETITQPVILDYPVAAAEPVLPSSQDISEVLAIHPYLMVDESTRMMQVQAGEWEIHHDLILPFDYGLVIAPGTSLKFDTGTVLLSRGPLQFQGTKLAPITIGPLHESWSGIVVLDAETDSHWSYTSIQGTSPVSRQGWILTGGVTFYDSPVYISHCIFQESLGEDALNIIRTQFSIEATTFQDTMSDAFDGDFTQGSITDSFFHAIAADGIDISGSDVTVAELEMQSIGDKGISVGESSRLTGSDISINQADFGIVSKDNSQVRLTQVALEDINTAGFAAYIKKPEYGPSTISVQDVDFGHLPPDKHTLVQTGSWIDLDTERIWGSDIDIDMLYNE